MGRLSVAVRGRLGDEAASDLEQFVGDAGDQWRQQVLDAAAERFENRLGLEMAGLRLEMQKSFADARQGLADLRSEIHQVLGHNRVELLRWSFVFWLGEVTVIAGLMAFMLRSVGAR